MESGCYLIIVVATVVLAIFGFLMILKKKKGDETDIQVIQRQIRGFAILVLSQLVMIAGLSLCYGVRDTLNSFKNMF
jgi:hypothetical protein